MSAVVDPLTQLEAAIISWLSTDPVLVQYNWQHWESDVELEEPRGFVNVSATGELDLGIQGPIMLQAEVVLESMPKTGLQGTVVPIMLAMLSGREIINRLNSQITDGSLFIAGPAESASVRQVIEKGYRQRRFLITYPAIWGIQYV